MQKAISYIILVFFYNTAYSQDISGTWRGSYSKSKFDKGIYELQFYIEQYDTLLNGIRTQFYDNNRYESYSIQGDVNKSDSTVTITETHQLSQNADGFGDNGNYKMKLYVRSSKQYLEGKWKNSSKGLFASFSSKVYLKKVDSTLTVNHNDTVVTKIIKTIIIDSSDCIDLKLELTDNAQNDGDIVSIYNNDKAIAKNITLSKKTETFIIAPAIQPGTFIIKMIAENQGSIPPCTATMRISTKKKSYIINMESDFSHNSAVSITIKTGK